MADEMVRLVRVTQYLNSNTQNGECWQDRVAFSEKNAGLGSSAQTVTVLSAASGSSQQVPTPLPILMLAVFSVT